MTHIQIESDDITPELEAAFAPLYLEQMREDFNSFLPMAIEAGCDTKDDLIEHMVQSFLKDLALSRGVGLENDNLPNMRKVRALFVYWLEFVLHDFDQ